jgi:hypothetical protein
MIRVSDAGPPEGDPVATWQPKLFPGLYPESMLRQSEMFPREERPPSPEPEDPEQPKLF